MRKLEGDGIPGVSDNVNDKAYDNNERDNDEDRETKRAEPTRRGASRRQTGDGGGEGREREGEACKQLSLDYKSCFAV